MTDLFAPPSKFPVLRQRASFGRPCTNLTSWRPPEKAARDWLLGTPPDPHLDGSRTQPEALPELAFQVAHVGRVNRAAGEEREGGRIGGALHRIEDTGPLGRVGRLELGDSQVQLAGGDAVAIGGDGALNRGKNTVHTHPGLGRDAQEGSIGEEGQALLGVPTVLELLLRGEVVPFVENHQHRATGGVDALGEALILVGHALVPVDDQQSDVGGVDRLQGPDHGVVLGSARLLGPPAHAGRVQEPERADLRLDHRIHGVGGGAGHVVHDRAVVAHQPVEEGRLAHVGAADDRHGEDVLLRFRFLGGSGLLLRRKGGKLFHHRIQQVAGHGTVHG